MAQNVSTEKELVLHLQTLLTATSRYYQRYDHVVSVFVARHPTVQCRRDCAPRSARTTTPKVLRETLRVRLWPRAEGNPSTYARRNALDKPLYLQAACHALKPRFAKHVKQNTCTHQHPERPQRPQRTAPRSGHAVETSRLHHHQPGGHITQLLIAPLVCNRNDCAGPGV